MAKTYIDGTSCKAVNGQFGEFFNISVNIEKLQAFANEKGYVNMTMSKRKEPGQYGDTHYFTLNEWSPESRDNENSNNNSGNSQSNNSNTDEVSVEDLPF
ncbi:hypothetical protein GW846_02220 [Candidatus Gracilibacteria bacterium]|nr:hypothetical protein [Candidatus Gracilibacteria bacterium]